MKQVLYIGVASEHGGAARSLLEMVSTIKKNYPDINPIVLCCHKTGHIDIYKQRNVDAYASMHAAFCFGREDSKVEFVFKYIPRYILYKIKNIYALKYIKKHIDFNTIDLIHSNSTRSDIGMILAKEYNIPHILHLREFGSKGTDYNVCYYRKKPLEYIDSHVDHYIAISNVVKDHWVAKNGYSSEKISVIYNGVDASNIVRKVDYRNTDQIRIVFTGYIMETKGQKRLIEELALMDPCVLKKLKVDFIGSGKENYVNSLKALVEKKHLDDIVSFLGKREDVHNILHKYDIGIVCSRSEAFGRVTAEYMLAGLCVLASDTGANVELIDNGVTGLLFEYSTPGDLSKKLETIVKDNDLRINLSKEAYTIASQRYITEINAANVVNLYQGFFGDKE